MENRIKELRKKLNLKQSELAEKINIAPSNISKYETGRLDIDTQTLLDMARVFDCTIEYLLGGLPQTERDRSLDLHGYENVIKVAKDAGIAPEELMEYIQTLQKIIENRRG
jgi:transcriptional regulator with XRE-family HTH domain